MKGFSAPWLCLQYRQLEGGGELSQQNERYGFLISEPSAIKESSTQSVQELKHHYKLSSLSCVTIIKKKKQYRSMHTFHKCFWIAEKGKCWKPSLVGASTCGSGNQQSFPKPGTASSNHSHPIVGFLPFFFFNIEIYFSCMCNLISFWEEITEDDRLLLL